MPQARETVSEAGEGKASRLDSHRAIHLANISRPAAGRVKGVGGSARILLRALLDTPAIYYQHLTGQKD